MRAKQAIARAAAAMVGEGEAVALDASTTAYYLALELRSKRELVVVTNGLLVAASLADAPGINVLVTGGELRLSAMSLVGDLGAELLRATRFKWGFLGARGLSLERGLMDLNPDEVRIKQEMADACEHVVCIADGTKWQRSALLSFVPPAEVHGIVTDAERARGPDRGVASARGRGHRRGGRRERARADAAGRSPPAPPGSRSASTDGDDGLRRSRRTERPRRVGRFDGERLAVSTVHRFPNVPVRTAGTLHWDVLRLFDGVLDGLRAARARGRRVDSVGVDSWGVDFALLDRAGRLVQNPVYYRDTRRAAAMDGVLAKVSGA